MNRQPPRRSALHILLSILTRKAPKLAKQDVQPPLHPDRRDSDAWHKYWQALGQTWRTEPEIDLKRQTELTRCRVTAPNIEKGIYPFKGMHLSRADIEWLLAMHEEGRGPVDWNDESQRSREGLDLRGADLRHVDLRGLPLARLRGGPTWKELREENDEQWEMAAAHMEEVDCEQAHLERADLNCAYLVKANFVRASLEAARLSQARLEGARFNSAAGAHADFRFAQLDGANFGGARLEAANFTGAQLRKAVFQQAELQGAIFSRSILQGTDFRGARLHAAHIDNVILGDENRVGPQLADVSWNDVNLTVVEWSQVKMLGDEQQACQKTREGVVKSKAERLREYEQAVRANRQLAVALQAQGLNEIAAHFAYRAQVLQNRVSWFQLIKPGTIIRQRLQALGAWLFSWFLFLLAGYGYKVWRSFLAYLLVIGLFMALYLLLDPHLAWYEAIVVSMTAFHGRGFSPSTFSPGDPVSIASAVEAFVGLIIEVTFIAALTRRFFRQ